MSSDELFKVLGGGFFLPMAALNEPMNAGLRRLIVEAKRARWTNAVVRKDGVETTHEADWIKHMVELPASADQMNAHATAAILSDRAGRGDAAAPVAQPPAIAEAKLEWEHLKQYGYAPGNYMNKCRICGNVVRFVDKRASICRPCAEERHAATQPPEPVQQTEAVDWKDMCAGLVDVYFDGVESPPGEGCYVPGSLNQVMEQARAVLGIEASTGEQSHG